MKGILNKHDVFSLLVLAEDNSAEKSLWLNEQFAYILQSPSHIIINVYGLKQLSADQVESFAFFENELSKKNKLLQFVYFPEDLKLVSPLAKSLKFPDSLAYALAAFSVNEAGQRDIGKIHFVKAFIDATIRVLFIQGKTLSQRGKINLKTLDREKLSGPISGMIKVASAEFPYEIIISFSEKCYLKLVSAMMGEVQFEITKDNRDGATEILNIIYGQAKLVLNQQNNSIAPQIPVLHIGTDYPASDCNIVHVPFSSDYGEFCVEVRADKNADFKKFFSQ